MERNKLLDKEVNIMVIKMLTRLELSENINKAQYTHTHTHTYLLR